MARPEKFDGFNPKGFGGYEVWLPQADDDALVSAFDIDGTSPGDAVTAVSTFAASRNFGGVGVNAGITAGATGDPSCVIKITGLNQFRETVSEFLTVTESASSTNPTVAGKVAFTEISAIEMVSTTSVSGATTLNVGYGRVVAGAAQLPVIGVPWRNFNDVAQIKQVIGMDADLARTVSGASSSVFTQANKDNSSFHLVNNSVLSASSPSQLRIYVDVDSIM